MFFAPPEVKSLSKYSEFGSHLGNKDFGIMVGVAVVLHIISLIIYSLAPHEQTMIIPVRVLNIKLNGGSADSNDPDMPAPSSMPGYQQPEAPPITLNTIEQQPAPPPPKSLQATADKTYANAKHKPLIEILSQNNEKRRASKVDDVPLKEHIFSTPKKYVREAEITHLNTTSKLPGNGSGITGTKEGQEIVSNYEQEISLWMATHKNYPQAAKEARIEGNAIVRIRINRSGHIIYSAIDTSSGNVMIDQAVIEMVHNSDPVPRVPDNYPEGRELEFLIPVSFKLK